MAAVLEVVLQFVMEVLAYGIGRAVAAVCLPHIKVERLGMQKSSAGWKWRGFTYRRGSNRFLYTESIQLLGVVAMLLVGTATGLMVRYTN